MNLADLFALSPAVRYAAIYRNGELEMRSRTGTANASSAESDKYEELIVNPGVLTLTRQRGEIDCGGLDYVLIRYGSFFQLVVPVSWGHLSVCIEPDADPIALAGEVVAALD